MRRALVVLLALLALAPAAALAQGRTYVPFQAFTTTSTGATFTVPLLLPDGSAAAPSLKFSSESGATGWYYVANQWKLANQGAASFTFGLGAFQITRDTAYISMGSSSDVYLYRDAANTLALRNGANAQTFNLYGTYTDSSNYHRMQFEGQSSAYGAGYAEIDLVAAGTGTVYNGLVISVAGAPRHLLHNSGHYPQSNDNMGFGQAGSQWRSAYFSRSIQGSKTKALTEASATAVTEIAVPQTAGSNFADATIEWAVYASDGTDSQVRKGSTYLAAVNKAGTETCTVGDIGTTQVAVSAGTLTCTTSCITGLTDVVQFALNCTSSLTQTTLNALARLDMMQPNTVTPQ